MKKTIYFLITLLLIFSSLTACSSNTAGDKKKDRIQIITTIFPEYDWVMNILGDNPGKADVSMLMDNGADLHSYQPTANDIMKIASCDLFIYVGGESDEWVEDALAEATNKNMIVLDLLDILGDDVKEEKVKEGMQEEDDDHDHEEGEVEYDEHVWLSLHNAEILCDSIAKAVERIDPANASFYSKNLASYKEKLNTLDNEYKTAVSNAEIKTLLFGDRFPFRYLVDDYGLDYYAAFAGCSAETEASFETIVFLANKVDELGLHSVMTIEGKDHSIAETIVRTTKTKDQTVRTMDSMQGTTGNDVKNGSTYLSIMENNLSVLKDALK